MLKPMLEPSLGSELPKKTNLIPKETTRYSKNQKPAFSKTIKKHLFFLRFLATEASQESLKKTKIAPRGQPKKIKTPKNGNPKMKPKIIQKIGPSFQADSKT